MESPGACSIFTGPMATTISRYATNIKILSDAVFAVLVFQFDGGETQEVNPNTVTYLASSSIDLKEVKSFKLTSGSIAVHFGHAKGTA